MAHWMPLTHSRTAAIFIFTRWGVGLVSKPKPSGFVGLVLVSVLKSDCCTNVNSTGALCFWGRRPAGFRILPPSLVGNVCRKPCPVPSDNRPWCARRFKLPLPTPAWGRGALPHPELVATGNPRPVGEASGCGHRSRLGWLASCAVGAVRDRTRHRRGPRLHDFGEDGHGGGLRSPSGRAEKRWHPRLVRRSDWSRRTGTHPLVCVCGGIRRFRRSDRRSPGHGFLAGIGPSRCLRRANVMRWLAMVLVLVPAFLLSLLGLSAIATVGDAGQVWPTGSSRRCFCPWG